VAIRAHQELGYMPSGGKKRGGKGKRGQSKVSIMTRERYSVQNGLSRKELRETRELPRSKKQQLQLILGSKRGPKKAKKSKEGNLGLQDLRSRLKKEGNGKKQR